MQEAGSWPPSPFGDRPADLIDEELGVASWLVRQGGMINRFRHGNTVTGETARFITTVVDAKMKLSCATAKRFYYIHDFSTSDGYTSEARRIFTSWGIESTRAGIVEEVVIIHALTNRLYAMGIYTAITVLRTAGMRVDTAPDIATVVQRFGLAPL